MKKFFLLTIIASLFLINCGRSDEDLDIVTLVGTWNWVSTDGGITGNIHDTPSSTGKVVKLIFDAENNYKIETNGTITNQGTYSLYKNISNLDHVERVYIDFSATLDQMIKSNDGVNLYISDDANDGVESHFQK